MKHWFVRARMNDEYGRWIPTGCANLADAKEYFTVFYPSPKGQVIEWLLM